MRSQIKRLLLLAALLVGLIVVPTTLGQTADPPQSTTTTTTQAAPPPTIVARRTVHPKRHITIRVHFRPWSAPTSSQVRNVIIPVEARGSAYVASTLYRRISCESGFSYHAQNGQYLGLGQFAYSTFVRGLGTLGSHRVSYTTTKIRHRPVRTITRYSNGTVKRSHGWKRRQYVRVIHLGRIPRHPAWTDGWAQVRIMAEAIRGQSAVHDSEWQCR